MHYSKIYTDLINRAKNRKKQQGYIENHHIIPRCLGGNDDDDNLVNLTAREHFIAHQLLLKIYPKNYKLISAAMMMCVASKTNMQRMSKNRQYEWLRKKYSAYASERQIGEKNNNYGKVWIYNIDQKISIRIQKEELDAFIESGWKRGRVIKFDGKSKICPICDQSFEVKDKTSKRKYCSKSCRNISIINNRADSSTIHGSINLNKEKIIAMHKDGKSMNAICKALGYPGAMGLYYQRIKHILTNLNIT